MTNTKTDSRKPGAPLSVVARHPIAVLLVASTAFVWVTQMGSLLAGVDVMPAKLGELLVLLGLAVWISSVIGGRREVRRLFAGLTRWRLGWRYSILVAALPLITVALAAVTGTLRTPSDGWLGVAGTYLLFLVLGAVTGNLWEETVWAGFVQGRLMAARGLLVGSLLTALPFFLMHLPLAFEVDGWKGTTLRDATIDWALILLAAPFLRYLIGTLLVDTGGSTLAAGIMHASFNAAGAMAVIPGGWQQIPGLIVLTLAVAAYRAPAGALGHRRIRTQPRPTGPAGHPRGPARHRRRWTRAPQRSGQEAPPCLGPRRRLIGSATKSFTALAVLQLAEAGRPGLDQPAVHYVADFRTSNSAVSDRITIRSAPVADQRPVHRRRCRPARRTRDHPAPPGPGAGRQGARRTRPSTASMTPPSKAAAHRGPGHAAGATRSGGGDVAGKRPSDERIGVAVPHPVLVLQVVHDRHVLVQAAPRDDLLPLGDRTAVLALDRGKVRRGSLLGPGCCVLDHVNSAPSPLSRPSSTCPRGDVVGGHLDRCVVTDPHHHRVNRRGRHPALLAPGLPHATTTTGEGQTHRPRSWLSQRRCRAGWGSNSRPTDHETSRQRPLGLLPAAMASATSGRPERHGGSRRAWITSRSSRRARGSSSASPSRA